MANKPTNIALFASGRGSNAKKIIEYFETHPRIRVPLLISNKSNAPALQMAQTAGLTTLVLQRQAFYDTTSLLHTLTTHRIDFLVLAGFLWLIPAYLVKAFPDRIINIHPALLPKYGGKGMYGMHVHQAVKEAKETRSGITIHLVNEKYDDGRILLQKSCPVAPADTPADIASKVHQLEYHYFAPTIEHYVDSIS